MGFAITAQFRNTNTQPLPFPTQLTIIGAGRIPLPNPPLAPSNRMTQRAPVAIYGYNEQDPSFQSQGGFAVSQGAGALNQAQEGYSHPRDAPFAFVFNDSVNSNEQIRALQAWH